MPSPSNNHFDVIVIGAGVMGCSAAWHLHQRGCKVLVLDSAPGPARQTTGSAAGFVGFHSAVHKLNWGQHLAQIQFYSLEFYRRLAERCAADFGFKEAGIAYLFLTEAGFDAHRAGIGPAREYGATVEILTRRQGARILPFVNFEQTKGIIHVKEMACLRAGDAVHALAAELKNNGVRFNYNMPVTKFILDGKRVGGVASNGVRFLADHVVLAAGAWTQSLLHQVGVACPATPCTETRFITRPIAGLMPQMPLMSFRDHQRIYLREEGGGLLIGGEDFKPTDESRSVDVNDPPPVDDIPPDQAFRVRRLLHDIEHVIPMLRDVEIGTISSGMPTFTEDDVFILDAVPGIASLYVMTGCQEAGVTHGPGLGRLIAELVTEGKTLWDRDPYRMTRFNTTD